MTQNDFVKLLATEMASTQKEAKIALDAFTTVVKRELGKGEEIKLQGFGVWSVVDKAERQGMNPKLNTPITIPAHKAVKFKMGKELKEVAKDM